MDVIDTLVGIVPGSPMDAVREGRKVARIHAQKSYEVLLTPAEPGDFTIAERFAIAAYVAGLHGAAPTATHYAAGLAEHGGAALAQTVAAAVTETAAEGPRGAYPPGPLSVEDTPAPAFALSWAWRLASGWVGSISCMPARISTSIARTASTRSRFASASRGRW